VRASPRKERLKGEELCKPEGLFYLGCKSLLFAIVLSVINDPLVIDALFIALVGKMAKQSLAWVIVDPFRAFTKSA